MDAANQTVRHLYVHVPFCAAKCEYCAFYSEAGREDRMAEYVDAVLSELEAFRGGGATGAGASPAERGAPVVFRPAGPWRPAVPRRKQADFREATVEDDRPPRLRRNPGTCDPVGSGGNVRNDQPLPGSGNSPAGNGLLEPATIFFGGGTPSLLPVPLMRRLLESVRRTGRSATPAEFTIECNPATVDTAKAGLYREFGVNRLSLGVQAFDDSLLRTLGRIHSAADAGESYRQIRAAGFGNVNLDLMFGLPGQSLAQFRATLEAAIRLEPEHLSVYCLTLEEDTRFWSLFTQGRLAPDAELERAMYELAVDRLTAAGYRHYEISNFARPGRECAHNLAYWMGEDYLGLGPSACSTVGNRRWQNVSDLDRYLEAFGGPRSEVRCSRSEIRDPGSGIRDPRSEVRGPRTAEGSLSSVEDPERSRRAVSLEETLTAELRAGERAAFGMRMIEGVPAEMVRDRWPREVAGLLAAGLVEWGGGRLRLTRRGLLFADDVSAEFVGEPG